MLEQGATAPTPLVVNLVTRLDQYITKPPTCMVNIIGHGGEEKYDDILKEYSDTKISFNAFFLSPVEQCLLNVSIKSENQCANPHSRWGKIKVFLAEFKTPQPSMEIINNIDSQLAGMQSYYVLSNSKNKEILLRYPEFARMNQGKFKARTPSNQFISFDCISSIDYVNYCNQLAGKNYTCLDNEFSGLILPLMPLVQTELGYIYTTGYDGKSIKMINPLQMPRIFADFSLFCDICAIQHMNPIYFNMIINLLRIRKNIGYNIIIQEIKKIPPCVRCEPIDELTFLEFPNITFDIACNYKIINIDIETIMMLFVLFLLISNNNIDELDRIERAIASGNLTNIFKTIDEQSLYPLDLLSHACRPGREEITRTITRLVEEGLPKQVFKKTVDDSDDDSDAETVMDDDESDSKTVIDDKDPDVTEIVNLLIRRSARVANRIENTGEQGSFYTSMPLSQNEHIKTIVTKLLKKDASTQTAILRRSLRLAKQEKAREKARKKARKKAEELQSKNSVKGKREQRRETIDPYSRGGKRTKRTKRNKRTKKNKRNKTSKRKKA